MIFIFKTLQKITDLNDHRDGTIISGSLQLII